VADESVDITVLLKAWQDGDSSALERLTPLVYKQLRRLAHSHMRREGGGDVLQTTALVHEAYLRLAKVSSVSWQDRVHFFSVSARIMRRILVDAARERAALKRGAARPIDWSLDPDTIAAPAIQRAAELCALDDALNRLAQLDPRRARVIELRFFGGLTVEETADVLSVSPRTVAHDWQLARAWLLRELA
jgi:RNA polymerase sigma factor (TIGR02999 family)